MCLRGKFVKKHDIADSLYFLPSSGMPRINEKTRSLYPYIQDWETGEIHYKNLRAPFVIAFAPHQKGVVTGIAGLNTDYVLNPPEIDALNKKGVSAIWMILPDIPGKESFLEDYRTLAEAFLTHNASPVHRRFMPDTPRIALTHSTGGQLFLSLMNKPATAKTLSAIFSEAVHAAPYLDSANASRDHDSAWRQTFLERYARMNINKIPDQTPLGKAYIVGRLIREELRRASMQEHEGCYLPQRLMNVISTAIKGVQDEDLTVGQTFGQILELQNRGREVMDAYQSSPGLKQMFLLGAKDPFASTPTSLAFAERHGIEVHVSDMAAHDPIHDAPELLETLFNRIHASFQRAPAVIDMEKPPALARSLYGSLQLNPPANDIDASGEGRTGLLNTAAGFFQSLGGGGVRNPKMG